MSKYDDIINLPHHTSAKRPRMSTMNRAAQFAAFAALTGHDAAISETARLTDEEMQQSEQAITLIEQRIQLLLNHLDEGIRVSVTYFKPDSKKTGGAYLTVEGIVKKIDAYERKIVMTDGIEIPVDSVKTLEGDLFSCLETSLQI